jgi:hypothetical protein
MERTNVSAPYPIAQAGGLYRGRLNMCCERPIRARITQECRLRERYLTHGESVTRDRLLRTALAHDLNEGQPLRSGVATTTRARLAELIDATRPERGA